MCLMSYRRAEYRIMEYSLQLNDIEKKIRKIKNQPRTIKDKNFITKNITLHCSFENRKEKNGNYICGLDLEYQISPKKGVPYQTTRDFYAVIFLPKEQMLVVLGRDTAISEVIEILSDILSIDTDRKHTRMFNHVSFNTESMVKVIKKMRKDDKRAWCDEYNGKHGAVKYQQRKTKSNFSLGEGNCVLDDSEAQEAIDMSTSISPKFKFYTCPRLNKITYEQPKTISFNGLRGVISISTAQNFDNWYRFIAEFLIDNLEIQNNR